jgi:hypothetical protein
MKLLQMDVSSAFRFSPSTSHVIDLLAHTALELAFNLTTNDKLSVCAARLLCVGPQLADHS